jgi:hypothetical protein
VLRLSFLFGLVTAVTACGKREATQASFITLDRDSSALKEAFNSDRGKVRVLMLVSPT